MRKKIIQYFLTLPYWTEAKIAEIFLFYGETSKITGGKLYNQVKGSSDWLAVAGTPNTFQCPNNATYLTADEDNIWFDAITNTQRTVTTAELISFDLQRTPVEYDDNSPNTIRVIGILKSGVNPNLNQLFKLFKLPIEWHADTNANGHIKDNRTTQILYPISYIVANSIAWHKPLDAGGESLSTQGSLWWDMRYGTAYMGAEQSSGVTVVGKYYKITAGSAWYFDCAESSDFYWKCTAVKTLDATHKVRELLGNFVWNGTPANVPVLGVANGTSQFMKSQTIAGLDQPIRAFLVAKQITYTAGDFLFEGDVNDSAQVQQQYSSPNLIAGAGTASTENANLPLGTTGLLKFLFKGASSKFQVNETTPVTGNFGINDMNGITYFRRGNSNAGYANAGLSEAIWFAIDVPDAMVASISKYIYLKWNIT